MSLDYNVYIGPFLKCKVEMKDVEKERYGCEKCLTYSYAKNLLPSYCSRCGREHTLYHRVEKVDSINGYDLMEEIKSALYFDEIEAGYHFWFGNKDKDIGYSFDPKEVENGYRILEVHSEDWRRFENFYHKEIKKIEEAYGKENVKRLWGVVHTVS